MSLSELNSSVANTNLETEVQEAGVGGKENMCVVSRTLRVTNAPHFTPTTSV